MTRTSHHASVKQDLIGRKLNPAIIQHDKYKGFDFITVNEVVRMLNEIYGGRWSFEIVEQWTQEILDLDILFHVQGRLTIDGFGTREQLGCASFRDHCLQKSGKSKKLEELEVSDVIPTNFDMCFKTAVSDCLKKLASYYGIAQELYGGKEEGLLMTEELTADQQSKMDQIKSHLGSEGFEGMLDAWGAENGRLTSMNFNSFLIHARAVVAAEKADA